MDLFGIKARRETKETARGNQEYEQYVNEKIDAASGENPQPQALNDLCDLFKSPYYELDPSRVEDRKRRLSERLNAKDLSKVVEAVIEKAHPLLFYASERDMSDRVPAKDDLAKFVASYFQKDPKTRDQALELMDRKATPQRYWFLAQATSHGYDSQVLAAYKQKLTSQTFGPWTDYMAQPLVDTIIKKTFDQSTRPDLREQGVEFLIDELKVKPKGKDIPRNIMYVTKIADALWKNKSDPIVKRRFEEVYNSVHAQAQMYSDFAMFSALTSLCNTNRAQVEEVENVYAGGEWSKRMFARCDPEDSLGKLGGLDAVREYIHDRGLSRKEIFKIPTAGTDYDRVPHTCEQTARELFTVLGA